jgi:hypothetical protein
MYLLPVEIAFYLLLRVTLLQGLALVVLFLSLPKSDLEFGEALLGEKDAEGNDGIAFLLDLGLEFPELAFREEKLAVMHGQVVVGRAETILGNMHVADPKLAIEEDTETVHEIDLAVADGFYFGAGQYHTRIVFVFDEILVIG